MRLTDRLQAGDWKDMTPAQIAESLGVTRDAVNSALQGLRKRGIQIDYDHGKRGGPAKRTCANCRYGTYISGITACQYILIEHQRRPCKAESGCECWRRKERWSRK